jgi:pimeloyl-ACP methyl ester carboxylesterase
MLSRAYWQPLIDRLSPYYQCLSYDLRGFGESQPCQSRAEYRSVSIERGGTTVAMQVPVAEYSLLSYAKDLGILLRQLNISRAWLVGHSLGGYVALWAADQLPEQVQGVICLNSGGGIYLKEAFERFRSAGQNIVKLRPRWLCQVPYLDLLIARANVARAIDRAWARQRLADFVRADREAAIGTLLNSTTEAEVHRLPQVVSRLNQPVYFITGTEDEVMEPQYVRHLASFHAGFRECAANVVELPNCGHMSMVEHPDLIAEKMRSLIQNHPQTALGM